MRSIRSRAALRQRREGEIGVPDMLVHIVGHHHHVRVAADDFAQRIELLARIGGPDGFDGELNITQRVFGVIAASSCAGVIL